jgi:hypothetical protein
MRARYKLDPEQAERLIPCEKPAISGQGRQT